MTQSANHHLLQIEQLRQTTVVRFTRRTILEPAAIQVIGDQLLHLVAEEGRRTVLVNFHGVESLTSAMIGEFAVLQRALNESGGRLAFCCVEPFLLQVFKIVKISDRIAIYGEEAGALEALAAQATETPSVAEGNAV